MPQLSDLFERRVGLGHMEADKFPVLDNRDASETLVWVFPDTCYVVLTEALMDPEGTAAIEAALQSLGTSTIELLRCVVQNNVLY